MYKVYVLMLPFFRAYGALLYANPGDNVTLTCFYASESNSLCWYKQVAGEQPQIISNSNTFHNQFINNKRFSVYTRDGFYHLNISNLQGSDSAMYYCGQITATVTDFDNGTFLVLKESSCRSFLQQPASDSVQPGGSVTLNCMVHTGSSDSDHSVYWFKKVTGNSHLGIMYIHTHSSTQCITSSEFGSPAQSCMYSLSKREVSLSDAGTYYCAVASCGQILFGEGTRLDVGVGQYYTSPVLKHCSVAALLVSVTLNIILICIIHKLAKRKYLYSEGFHPHSNTPETSEHQNEECDALQYVALDFKKRQGKSRRQRSTEEGTVYSGIRLSDIK